MDHLRQSIEDILTTPIGSRVMRRTYGSRLYELIDKPQSAALKLDIFAATVDALKKWEPRFKVDRVFVTFAEAGRFVVGITGTDKLGNRLDVEGLAL